MLLRWTAALLTVLALGGGVWGVAGWLDSGPPPLGDIALESVTPPNAQLEIRRNSSCDKTVPGYWAEGQSNSSPEAVQGWFDLHWGPALIEPTARFNARDGLRGTTTVYESITVWIVAESGGSHVRVTTYETDGHFCHAADTETWGKAAAVFTDHCNELIIDFWGVEYGATGAADPPSGWDVLTFPGGQQIAHSLENPLVIYARVDSVSGWSIHEQGQGCYLD